MRKKKIDEAELPIDNLAVYQLVDKKSGGIIKDFALKLNVPPQTIQHKVFRTFDFDSLSALPQERRPCPGALFKACLLARRRDALAWKRIGKQVKIRNCPPRYGTNIAIIRNVAMYCSVGCNGVHLHFRYANDLIVEIGKVML